MCWRDDVVMHRSCSFCHQIYFGDLGHRNCPALQKDPPHKPKKKIPIASKPLHKN